ncbi:MAG: hypothetical protein GY823_06020 [Flavobacteriaceae bacterium]|nr:hypothetical protein [Flavobacteriaceae bacterium]
MDKSLVFLVIAMTGIFALALTYNKLQRKTVKCINENLKIKNFNSNQFQVIENPGNGDCLFYCFKQALESIGVKTTIKQLRYKVSESMDKDKLETLKTIYLVAKNDKNYDILKDYYFMENVNTLKDLRKVIMTRLYYGDDMAIAALEEYTGINVVIISDGVEQIRFEKPKGNNYIVLVLKNIHYRLLGTINCKFVFKGKPVEAIEAAKIKF